MSRESLLGRLVEWEGAKDAVHIAICPVTAGEDLLPGQRVEFWNGNTHVRHAEKRSVGIIDPFLDKPVIKGQRCYLCLYPGSITSLRHDWSHPAFTSDSEQWIRDFAERMDLTYNRLMAGAAEYLKSGQYLVGGSNLEGEYVPEEFWTHYEIVTGEKVPHDERNNFFSCAC